MNHFVEVLGKKMEVCIKGTSSQIVVIHTGMGCSFYDWMPIAEKLALHYKVILFHRPGYGKSEIDDEPRTILHAAKELRELLHMLTIRQPIILVGHSYGGLCAQQFAMLYPEQLKAIVLVDSTSMDLHRLDDLDLPVSNQTDSDEIWLQKYIAYSKMDQNTLYVELQSILSNQYSHLASHKQKQYMNFSTSPSLYKATASELLNWKTCAKKMKQLEVTLQTPFIIIGRDPNYSIEQMIESGMPSEEAIKLEDMWQELIQEQLMLSQNSKYILAQHASHGIEHDRPDIIIDAVHSVQGGEKYNVRNHEYFH
ncbi:alpha/beta fold hydrolase [Bacillus sp. Xin]|uniref:alpha/beta fold hydrolase n=1 Tax=unclassified Bacillus (in: firmicutes) TaxID=185979 RepID=UPI0015745D1D|nr:MULTISPECIES: alpha/beta fold hydrolase [unclassified Bacillus (in: firmicutes)]MBC6974106.1 alpha/beta fold hydrolase [Bacillus sp. Xin]NSW39097.1 alpha/beta fold hydrolase [Bacillus sp. Xin1]